jgi:NAD-dependent deacetylase sirtuin 4
MGRPCSNLAFVPPHLAAQGSDIERLQEFLGPTRRLLVLTGAGISTESGIPDYRSEGVGLYATSSKRPIQHKTFMESNQARQSYWAR